MNTAPMNDNNETGGDPVVAVFDTHQEAEEAISKLCRAGFGMDKLSLIGRGGRSLERPIGFYSIGDQIRSSGEKEGFWGSMWGILAAPAVFLFPHVGLLATAGPVGLALAASFEGAAVVEGLSEFGSALRKLGMAPDKAVKYEADIKADRYLVLVHGDLDDQARAQAALA